MLKRAFPDAGSGHTRYAESLAPFPHIQWAGRLDSLLAAKDRSKRPIRLVTTAVAVACS